VKLPQSTVDAHHFMLPSERPYSGNTNTASDKHSELVLRRQLELESLKSQQLASQVQFIQKQLEAETAARINLQVS